MIRLRLYADSVFSSTWSDVESLNPKSSNSLSGFLKGKKEKLSAANVKKLKNSEANNTFRGDKHQLISEFNTSRFIMGIVHRLAGDLRPLRMITEEFEGPLKDFSIAFSEELVLESSEIIRLRKNLDSNAKNSISGPLIVPERSRNTFLERSHLLFGLNQFGPFSFSNEEVTHLFSDIETIMNAEQLAQYMNPLPNGNRVPVLDFDEIGSLLDSERVTAWVRNTLVSEASSHRQLCDPLDFDLYVNRSFKRSEYDIDKCELAFKKVFLSTLLFHFGLKNTDDVVEEKNVTFMLEKIRGIFKVLSDKANDLLLNHPKYKFGNTEKKTIENSSVNTVKHLTFYEWLTLRSGNEAKSIDYMLNNLAQKRNLYTDIYIQGNTGCEDKNLDLEIWLKEKIKSASVHQITYGKKGLCRLESISHLPNNCKIPDDAQKALY